MDVVNETGYEAGWVVSRIAPPHSSLIAVVKGTFRLRPGATVVPADEQAPLTGDTFVDGDASKALRYPSDFAPFKPRADILLVGTCHAPGGRPVTAARVTIGVGTWRKSLIVSGDRPWTASGRPSDPVPFTSLPLSWERAYGAPYFRRNPLGRGAAATLGGPAVPSLPNVEYADKRIRIPSDVSEPAGFGPIADTWAQRLEKFGKFSSTYLRERWPSIPPDTDWTFFNSAPEDQQIEGYLRGDEELFFENLHPEYAEYNSRLPGLRVRCFLDERLRAQHWLREIPMRLDTMWVDMDAETLILVWRGIVGVRSQTLLGTEHFFAMVEPIVDPPTGLAECERLLEDALARREMADDELDEEEAEEEEPEPDSSESAENADVQDRSAEEDEEEADEPEEDSGALSIERVRQMVHERASFAGCDLSGLSLNDLDLSGLDFRDAILQDAILTRANLSRADCTGAVLAGANLREAICVETTFHGADLTGTWLTGAVLTEADLREADLTRSCLRHANLSRVRATDAVFAEADLSDANLRGAQLHAADLCDARAHRADFTGADLTDAALENAWGRHVVLAGATVVKVRGAEAQLREADFRGCHGREAVWQFADLSGSRFDGSEFDEGEFAGATLSDTCFDGAELKGARLNEAILHRARMRRCNFLGASLDEADLTGAFVAESNLFGASLVDVEQTGADFTAANLRRTKSRQETT